MTKTKKDYKTGKKPKKPETSKKNKKTRKKTNIQRNRIKAENIQK